MNPGIKKYRKIPVTIEAVQWTGSNREEVSAFMNHKGLMRVIVDSLYVDTLEGSMRADPGDFIIKGIAGEFYPCKPDIFNKTYEEVIE